jgi:hypothetical protein
MAAAPRFLPRPAPRAGGGRALATRAQLRARGAEPPFAPEAAAPPDAAAAPARLPMARRPRLASPPPCRFVGAPKGRAGGRRTSSPPAVGRRRFARARSRLGRARRERRRRRAQADRRRHDHGAPRRRHVNAPLRRSVCASARGSGPIAARKTTPPCDRVLVLRAKPQAGGISGGQARRAGAAAGRGRRWLGTGSRARRPLALNGGN